MDAPAMRVLQVFVQIPSVAIPADPPHFLRWRRRGRVFAFLTAAVLFFALPSPSAARLVRKSGDVAPDGVRLAGGTYTAVVAGREIHEAAVQGYPERLTSLLATWPELLNARDEAGMTPLFLAAAFGQAEVARRLLDRGADMHAADRSGVMPFHQAAYGGHAGIVEMLLERSETVDVRDGDGRTALHLAASRDREEIARLLIEKGARVDATDDAGGGATPLHYAAALGSTAVARLLLEHCADVHAVARKGVTPLHVAVSRKQHDMVRLLLAHDAGVQRPDAGGRTALDLAVRMEDGELEILLRGKGEAGARSMAWRAVPNCPHGP